MFDHQHRFCPLPRSCAGFACRLLFSSEFYDPSPHMRRVIRFISQQFPFWNATGGRDHVFWLARDKGVLIAPAVCCRCFVLPTILQCRFNVDSLCKDPRESMKDWPACDQ